MTRDRLRQTAEGALALWRMCTAAHDERCSCGVRAMADALQFFLKELEGSKEYVPPSVQKAPWPTFKEQEEAVKRLGLGPTPEEGALKNKIVSALSELNAAEREAALKLLNLGRWPDPHSGRVSAGS